MGKQEQIFEHYPDDYFVFADGYEEAIIGIEEPSMKVVYDEDKCISILVNDGMDIDDAIEYFEFNTKGSHIGDRTPIFIKRLFDK